MNIGMKLGHIVNPVNLRYLPKNVDLHIAQPIVLESMVRAKNEAKNHGIDVTLYAFCQDEEVKSLIPDDFIKLPIVKRDIRNERPDLTKDLPFIKDILDSLYHNSDANYMIYTNVDIILSKNFYKKVYQHINNKGWKSFSINREIVSSSYKSTDELPEIEKSKNTKKHPGHDCFVFKRNLYDKFKLGKMIIGAKGVGRSILYNLQKQTNHRILKNEKITFHIGEDDQWTSSDEYSKHNKKELKRLGFN